MKKGEDTSMVAKRLSGQDLGYPCAITRRYTSSTQSRDALRVHPRTRHPLTPSVLFSALTTLSPSFSRFLPRQIATITYTCQYITHPTPPQPSFHRTKYSTFPDVSIPRLSLSFPLFPPRLEKNEGKVWGPDRYLYFSLI